MKTIIVALLLVNPKNYNEGALIQFKTEVPKDFILSYDSSWQLFDEYKKTQNFNKNLSSLEDINIFEL